VATRKSDHPSYPNPTLVEALCEVHFALSPENPWKMSFPGLLLKSIGRDYEETTPAQSVALQFEVTSEGMGQALVPLPPRARFKHKTEPFLIQLAQNTFTVNALAPYPGWHIVQPRILAAWVKATAVLNPSAITRIGLRYINRVRRQSTADQPGNWFRASDYLPAGILSSASGFTSRVEARLNTQDRVVVSLADQPPTPDSEFGAFIFDIDRIRERSFPPTKAVLKQVIDTLHDDVWGIFAAAKGRQLERVLSGDRT
jgi:uncharacterized protein (TIGR04255 family)